MKTIDLRHLAKYLKAYMWFACRNFDSPFKLEVGTHRESRPSGSGGRRRRPAPRQSRRAPPPHAQPSAAHGPPAPRTAASSASAAVSASACRMLHLPRRASSPPRLGGARARPADIVASAASCTTDRSLHSLCTGSPWRDCRRCVASGDTRFARYRCTWWCRRGAADGETTCEQGARRAGTAAAAACCCRPPRARRNRAGAAKSVASSYQSSFHSRLPATSLESSLSVS